MMKKTRNAKADSMYCAVIACAAGKSLRRICRIFWGEPGNGLSKLTNPRAHNCKNLKKSVKKTMEVFHFMEQSGGGNAIPPGGLWAGTEKPLPNYISFRGI